MNVAARRMGRTLCYISAERIVQQVSALNNSIQTVDRRRHWIRGRKTERTKCNGAFSSSQSENSCRSWAQPHWPGWKKGKGRKRDHKKGREQEIGSVSFIQHYNLGRWIAFVALRGSLFLFFSLRNLYPQSNNQTWCQQRGSHPSSECSVTADVFDWEPVLAFIPH